MNTVLEANQNSLSEKRKKSEKLVNIHWTVWVVMEQLRSNASSSYDCFPSSIVDMTIRIVAINAFYYTTRDKLKFRCFICETFIDD